MEVVIGRNMITGGLYTRPVVEIVLNKTLNFSINKNRQHSVSIKCRSRRLFQVAVFYRASEGFE